MYVNGVLCLVILFGSATGAVTTPPCRDVDPHCAQYGYASICTSSVSNWAKQYCARYCGFCTVPTHAPTTITTTHAPTTITTTHAPTTITTTDKSMRPTLCEVCTGPKEDCELQHHTVACHYPDNLCLNHIINYDTGRRTVGRRCANHQTCYREWYLGSSDSDRCQLFEQSNIYTLGFVCTYCCTKDHCNTKLHPPQYTLM